VKRSKRIPTHWKGRRRGERTGERTVIVLAKVTEQRDVTEWIPILRQKKAIKEAKGDANGYNKMTGKRPWQKMEIKRKRFESLVSRGMERERGKPREGPR